MENGVIRTCENDVKNFASLACVCGLSFPDSANQFQKSALTLAHLMASLRESILKGSIIPEDLIEAVRDLAGIMFLHSDEQYLQR